MKEKFYRFMQGRYGNDQLNRFLMVLVMISLLLSLFGVRPFYLVGIAILVWSYSRMFSRNIYKRQAENSVYLRYEYKVRQKFAGWKKAAKQRKTHHIYKCPSCSRRSGSQGERERSRSDVPNADRPLSEEVRRKKECLDILSSIKEK